MPRPSGKALASAGTTAKTRLATSNSPRGHRVDCTETASHASGNAAIAMVTLHTRRLRREITSLIGEPSIHRKGTAIVPEPHRGVARKHPTSLGLHQFPPARWIIELCLVAFETPKASQKKEALFLVLEKRGRYKVHPHLPNHNFSRSMKFFTSGCPPLPPEALATEAKLALTKSQLTSESRKSTM